MEIKTSIESVMRSPPVIALFSDNISSIVDKMISNNIGAVIINSGGLPVGIVTERDLIEKVMKFHKNPEKTNAQDIMSSPLISVEIETSLMDALRLMRDKKIRRLGVTKQKRLIGIVTERRLLDSLV